MKKSFLFIVAICFFASSQAQKLPCRTPVYRQFDFWIGEWEAFGPDGKKAGDSKISLMLDSCTILEEWTGTGIQQGLRYAGKSYNMYNATKKRWQQYWVDNAGNITQYFNGHFEDNKMIVQTENDEVSPKTFLIQKMTFFNLGPDKVRQFGETSSDSGKTWVTGFDLEYRRKPNNTAIVVDSILRGMEDGYAKGRFQKIASYYVSTGKIIGKDVEISGKENLVNYWKGLVALGGTWKLSNTKTEKIGESIWQKGVSVITDKGGKQHKVNFTLVLIQEDGIWRILQDTYW
jgi:hypothetical protein